MQVTSLLSNGSYRAVSKYKQQVASIFLLVAGEHDLSAKVSVDDLKWIVFSTCLMRLFEDVGNYLVQYMTYMMLTVFLPQWGYSKVERRTYEPLASSMQADFK